MSELYAIVLSGGAGTRLWPRSRRAQPKQFLDLLGARSLFADTLARIAPLIPPDRTLVAAPAEHEPLIRADAPGLPARNLVVEPYPRGNAAAIALATARVAARDPHNSFTRSQKDRATSFLDVPPGLAGAETLLPYLLSDGVAAGAITLERAVELLCTNPARIYHLQLSAHAWSWERGVSCR